QEEAIPYVDMVVVNATQAAPNWWILATVTIRNNGTTDVTGGSVVLTFNDTINAINPTVVNQSTGLTLVAGGRIDVQIRFQIAAIAQNNIVICVDATFNGTEDVSNRAVSDTTANSPALVRIVIVSMMIVGGRTPYVRGEQFVVRAFIDNFGGTTQITNGILMLEFSPTTGISANTTIVPDPINIGQVVTKDFLVTTTSMTSASCNINARFTGNNPGACNISSNIILITTQAEANVTITNLAVAPAGPCVGGTSFTLTVTYNNTGGTAATVDGACTAGTYTFLTFSDPIAVVVNAGNTNTQIFTVSIAAGATTNASVDIHVTWSGIEAISSRSIGGDAPVDQVLVAIQAQANVVITSLILTPTAAPGPYVAGTSFTLTVTYSNVGGTNALNVNAGASAGIYVGLTFNNPVPITVNAINTNTQQFMVTIAAGAGTNTSVDIHVIWSGTEAITGRSIGGDTPVDAIIVSIQSQTSVTITNVIVSGTNGTGPYSAGRYFLITVMFSNTGGTSALVDATLDDGNCTFLTWDDPSMVTVASGSTNMQNFIVSIAVMAPASSATVTAIWSGSEAMSGRSINGDMPVDTVNVEIIPSGVSLPMITSPADLTFDRGTTGHVLSWTITATNVGITSFVIYQNSAQVNSGAWTNSTPILVNLDALAVGNYNYTIIVNDGFGGIARDEVLVTVNQGQGSSPPENTMVYFMFALLIAGAMISIAVMSKKHVFWRLRHRTTASIEKGVPFPAYTGSDPFVFVSYAHMDKNLVYPIIEELNRKGVRIWYDEGIPASTKWRKTIAEKIMNCSVFMLFLSPIAVERENVLDEIALAEARYKNKEIALIPVQLESTKLTPELMLSIGRIQAVMRSDFKDEQFIAKLLAVLPETVHDNLATTVTELDEQFKKWDAGDTVKDGKI
nr:toll/interleukin-1 receptor domain-containing protein [Candidatus Sigynarchaeota archaeon]